MLFTLLRILKLSDAIDPDVFSNEFYKLVYLDYI